MSGSESTGLRVDVVVPAAGSSRRMAGQDKLEARVGGLPVLAWTLASLAAAPEVARIVVVVPADRIDEIRRAAWLPASVIAVVAGGPRRQESVANGVGALRAAGAGAERVVLVHDAARPVVTPELVARVAAAAASTGAAIPVVPVADTLKRIAGDVVAETVDRNDLAAAQTPQGVRLGVLEAAYQR